MSDLAINAKGENNLSLDHPNFGDVYLTTYQKGIITDVLKIGDDPIAVQSLVKVESSTFVYGGYIPIWYRPKPQYWGANATDLSEDQQSYLTAWRSFRVGDGVVVMCRNGIPYSVVGFEDRVPRIGEEMLKIQANNITQYYSMTQGTAQDVATGPDGVLLNLLKEVTPFNQDTSEEVTDYTWVYISSIPINMNYGTGFPIQCTGGGCRRAERVYSKYTTYHYYYIISIGAILYAIRITRTKIESFNYHVFLVTTPEGDWQAMYDCNPGPPLPTLMMDDGSLENGTTHPGFAVGPNGDPEPEITEHVMFQVSAGVYTQDLVDQIEENPAGLPWGPAEENNNPAYDGMLFWQDGMPINQYPGDYGNQHFQWPIQLFTRPHTKEELQEAGLWP
jgi:hypothetical protein